MTQSDANSIALCRREKRDRSVRGCSERVGGGLLGLRRGAWMVLFGDVAVALDRERVVRRVLAVFAEVDVQRIDALAVTVEAEVDGLATPNVEIYPVDTFGGPEFE